MQKVIIFVLTIGLIFTSSLLIFGKQLPTPKTETIKNIKPISTLSSIDLAPTCKLFYIVNKDIIEFNPNENVCDNVKSFNVAAKDYPNLFKQGVAESSLIQVTRLSPSSKFVQISNNQPDHGGYSPTYTIIVNPETGKVVFASPEYINNSTFPTINAVSNNAIKADFFSYGIDQCTSCRLNFVEIFEYDNTTQTFKIANGKYKSEFVKIFEQYKNIEKTGCYYNGQNRSIPEIKSLGGDSAVCESRDGSKIANPLSVGKFYSILSNLQKILKGESVSMLN